MESKTFSGVSDSQLVVVRDVPPSNAMALSAASSQRARPALGEALRALIPDVSLLAVKLPLAADVKASPF